MWSMRCVTHEAGQHHRTTTFRQTENEYELAREKVSFSSFAVYTLPIYLWYYAANYW
jgi:hypothetical protein